MQKTAELRNTCDSEVVGKPYLCYVIPHPPSNQLTIQRQTIISGTKVLWQGRTGQDTNFERK